MSVHGVWLSSLAGQALTRQVVLWLAHRDLVFRDHMEGKHVAREPKLMELNAWSRRRSWEGCIAMYGWRGMS